MALKVSPSDKDTVHPTDVARWLAQWVPRKIEAATWAKVRGFVIETVMMTDPASIESAARVARVVMKLAVWCQDEGLALEREQIFDPAIVERFTAVSEIDSRSRATDRWQLRKVGPLVTTAAPWEAKHATVARRNVAAPYSATEMRQLREDAQCQPTALKRQAARALLVLGTGAGLDGRWVARVTPSDVTTRNGAVLIRVGAPSPRVVPVSAQFEDEVLEMVASCTTDALIGMLSKSANRVAVITKRLTVAHGHPRFSAARFRSTWLKAYLHRVGLSEFMTAAGLHGLGHLSDLVPYVEDRAEDEVYQLLRGSPW
jgi:hypothetical protein